MTVVTALALPELLRWERAVFREYQFADYSQYKTGRLAFLKQCADKYSETGPIAGADRIREVQ